MYTYAKLLSYASSAIFVRAIHYLFVRNVILYRSMSMVVKQRVCQFIFEM